MLTVMANAKSKEKKGKRAKLSKVRKKGNKKKKVTAKARTGAKKKAARRKSSSRPKVTHAETASAPAAFTEIASEEMTSSPPAPGETAMIESTEPMEAGESGFTSTEGNSINKSSM
jgi:hypothetical protein